MVGAKHFSWINNRCAMVKNRHPNSQDFEKVNVLAVGDLYQLAPVMQRQVFVETIVMLDVPVILHQ